MEIALVLADIGKYDDLRTADHAPANTLQASRDELASYGTTRPWCTVWRAPLQVRFIVDPTIVFIAFAFSALVGVVFRSVDRNAVDRTWRASRK
jgi:hypothetical protein